MRKEWEEREEDVRRLLTENGGVAGRGTLAVGLLAEALLRLGGERPVRVRAEDREWLEVGGEILDPTASQFEEWEYDYSSGIPSEELIPNYLGRDLEEYEAFLAMLLPDLRN